MTETKESDKNANMSKNLKHSRENEDSSDDDITLSRLKPKKTKRPRILESDEEGENPEKASGVQLSVDKTTKKSTDS